MVEHSRELHTLRLTYSQTPLKFGPNTLLAFMHRYYNVYPLMNVCSHFTRITLTFRRVLFNNFLQPISFARTIMAAIESEASFVNRAKAIGVSQAVIDLLLAKDLKTFGSFAFCCPHVPGTADEGPEASSCTCPRSTWPRCTRRSVRFPAEGGLKMLSGSIPDFYSSF